VTGEGKRESYRGSTINFLCKHTGKWPDLEAEGKNCITDHRNNMFPTSTKIIISEVRTRAVAHGTPDFAGTP
jgi:hypothetical protein